MTAQLYEEQQEVVANSAADVRSEHRGTQDAGPVMATQTETSMQKQIRKLQRQVEVVINAAKR